MADTGKIIKEKREAKKWTQEFLAKVVGVKHNTICGYEIGIRKPRGKIAKKLAAVLEIPIEDII